MEITIYTHEEREEAVPNEVKTKDLKLNPISIGRYSKFKKEQGSRGVVKKNIEIFGLIDFEIGS